MSYRIAFGVNNDIPWPMKLIILISQQHLGQNGSIETEVI